MSTTHDTSVYADGMACAMRRGVTPIVHRPKVVNQYRRARRLADELAATYGAGAVVEAESFSAHWEALAGWITTQDGKPFRSPSADTIALTIYLLTEKTER